MSQILRTRESMQAPTQFLAVALRKPIQECDAGRQTELLTRNPVYQAFKDGSKTRRLKPSKRRNELVQAGMSGRECVELRKVYIDPQQTLQHSCDVLLNGR